MNSPQLKGQAEKQPSQISPGKTCIALKSHLEPSPGTVPIATEKHPYVSLTEVKNVFSDYNVYQGPSQEENPGAQESTCSFSVHFQHRKLQTDYT